MRAGLAYNGANIYSYFFTDGAPGGVHGPFGDYTLYSHFQVGAQGSVYLGKGLTAIVSGLNLNNEVFGFYYGRPQYFTQREYYNRRIPSGCDGIRVTRNDRMTCRRLVAPLLRTHLSDDSLGVTMRLLQVVAIIERYE